MTDLTQAQRIALLMCVLALCCTVPSDALEAGR